MIADTRGELDNIRKWINAGNQFDSKTRYLISYAVIKASGTVEVIFKNMIYNCLSDGANEKAKGYFTQCVENNETSSWKNICQENLKLF